MAQDVNLRLRLRRVNLDTTVLMQPGGAVYEATKRAAEEAVKLAKQEAPKRTGGLADSIEYRIVSTPTKVIADIGAGRGVGANGTPYLDVMRYVTFGTTGPIRSTTPGKKMRLQGGGAVIYRDEVAGQAANPFLITAVRQIRRQSFEP